jgi:hypothetical protein
MSSPNPYPSLGGTPDELLDQVERALLDLATATLDDETKPAESVDEFSNEFLMQWGAPPQ